MMHDMSQWTGDWGPMMWEMRLWWALALVLAAFGIGALATYLFSDDHRHRRGG